MTQSTSAQAPTSVTHVLKGIDFPARRGELLRRATENRADAEVLHRIERMPDQEYATMADVMKGFGKAH
jgi:hypothetical protein